MDRKDEIILQQLETIRTMEGELSIRGIDTAKDNGFM